jgi:hypothetical protein
MVITFTPITLLPKKKNFLEDAIYILNLLSIF